MKQPCAPFGTLLGMAPGDVPVYSSHYPSVNSSEFPDRESYRSYLDGIYMGHKWQCVEFARRWMYLNQGVIFDDVAMAYDIFELRKVRVIRDNALLSVQSFKNGNSRPPLPGCLLIWNEGGEFEDTGHVAIITEVLQDRVRIAEQNMDHQLWPAGQNWARELELSVDEQGRYWIQCTFDEGSILGWMILSEDARDAEPRVDPEPQLFNLIQGQIEADQEIDPRWIDADQPAGKAFLAMMGGPWLTQNTEDQRSYFGLSESAAREIKHATNELHAMFMHATHKVLKDDTLLARFNLPQSIWPRLRQSWNNRRNEMITGRLDFSVSERGIKVYEYNADSASCYYESAFLQGPWFDACGVSEGRCPGQKLHPDLVRAWRKSGVDTLLHIMQDDDPEEDYHAQFMKSAAEQAGIRCKLIRGMEGLDWDAEGFVVDAEGERILWVWKTWAWETALDQLRAECDEDETLAAIGDQQVKSTVPRLVDVLLRQEVMVYEPLWTLIPSNKAILPVLWQLFPDHPNLLESHYSLNQELQGRGYVTKPIAGRCGHNISIVDGNNAVLEETGGRFSEQDQIYQALCKLPVLGKFNVQLATYTVAGKYSAASVRVDTSPVITTHSDLLPLRILQDERFV